MASYTVNPAAVDHATRLIKAHHYVLDSDWGEAQPKADDENTYLDKHSWDDYGAWHLGSPRAPTTRPKPGTDS